jgi:hypothetical protein
MERECHSFKFSAEEWAGLVAWAQSLGYLDVLSLLRDIGTGQISVYKGDF